MSLPVKTGFPDAITCKDGYIVRFAAVDPVTGADVAGVVVSNVSIFSDTGANVTQELSAPLLFVSGPPDTTA